MSKMFGRPLAMADREEDAEVMKGVFKSRDIEDAFRSIPPAPPAPPAPLQPDPLGPPAPLEPINPKDSLGLAKVSLSKVPVAGLIHEALAMRDGAVKYGPHNWREYPVIATVYYDACLRHMMAWFDGEEEAPDSGVHHLGHAKACLGILLDAMENGKLGDDRPLPGAAARLFAENVQGLSPEPNDALRAAAAELYQRALDNGSLETEA